MLGKTEARQISVSFAVGSCAHITKQVKGAAGDSGNIEVVTKPLCGDKARPETSRRGPESMNKFDRQRAGAALSFSLWNASLSWTGVSCSCQSSHLPIVSLQP